MGVGKRIHNALGIGEVQAEPVFTVHGEDGLMGAFRSQRFYLIDKAQSFVQKRLFIGARDIHRGNCGFVLIQNDILKPSRASGK